MEADYLIVQMISIVLRIVITVYCVNRAKKLNRSQGGWGLFGFFFPLIALIWIQFMKPRMQWDHNPPVN
jgi:hypothetical protein